LKLTQNEEETKVSEWSEEVEKVTKFKKKEIVWKTELDVIRANLDSIRKEMKDAKGKNKKQLKDIKLICMNALNANQMLLEKLNEINHTNPKPSRQFMQRNSREEEDSPDEISNFPENTDTQSEEELQNNMPNDIIILKTTMQNELNDDIKITIPRIQRTHYAKIKERRKDIGGA
jgi:hypothetical protein